MHTIRAELTRLQQEHLYRRRRIVEGAQTPHQVVDGREVISFCSNDYLGLANHPEVIRALQRGAEHYGVGSGAAHLINGHAYAHHALEEELAAFVGQPRALLFSTGYMANLGVIDALCPRGHVVFEDRLNHASLLDGARLALARLQRYSHGDIKALTRLLTQHHSSAALIVSDGVFSMDGDLAPLPQLVQLAHQHSVPLLIDDAHGFGVVGATGRGCIEHFDLATDQTPILVGTLGKAFGTFGAFVAGSEELIEFLIQKARTYVYTTALPPAIAEATRTSLRLVQTESWRREHLQHLITRFRKGATELGLTLTPSPTPIQPLIIGEADAALRTSQKLLEQGIFVGAVRPPTVPAGTARLRITFSAAHSESDVDRLLSALEASI